MLKKKSKTTVISDSKSKLVSSKSFNSFFKPKKWWLAAAYLVIYAVAVILVVLHRWWQFEVYYFDHGIFDHSLWQVAQGSWPLIDHLQPIPLNQLGDHFTPSLYLLAPLYWLTNAYELLFIIQSLAVMASAAVMFILSRRLLGDRLVAYALLVAFTLFVGLQNALIAGFHTELPALATLALTLYFMETKRWKWFWLFLILTVGFKEIFVSISAGIAAYLILTKQWKMGMAVLVYSFLHHFVANRVAIPYFSGQPYRYTTVYPSVLEMTKLLVVPAIKIRTILISFVSFGLISLLALPALPILLQDLLVRFVLSPPGQAMTLTFHYSATISVLLYFTAIKGAQVALKWSWYKQWSWVHALVIILLSLGLHYKLQGPLGLAYNASFYSHTHTMKFLRDFVNQVPNQGLVMTQNNLAPHLTHSHNVMLLRLDYENYQPDVIALDIRAGQGPNNYWPVSVMELYDKLKLDPRYRWQPINPEQGVFIKQ